MFHKRKITRILREYRQEWIRVIPDNLLLSEELNRMKQLRLEELAALYDLLEGYKYHEHYADGVEISPEFHIPGHSRYVPCFELHWHKTLIGVVAQTVKNLKFVQTTDYITYPDNLALIKLLHTPKHCWKNCI